MENLLALFDDDVAFLKSVLSHIMEHIGDLLIVYRDTALLDQALALALTRDQLALQQEIEHRDSAVGKV